MRNVLLAFGLIGLGAMSASFAACSSSSSDDSTGTPDSGADTSVPTDSGTPDTSTPVDSGACAVCAATLTGGLGAGSPCTASVPILSALLSCVCTTNPLTSGSGQGLCDTADAGVDAGDGGGPSAACSDLCANAASGAIPTTACGTCAADNCSTEIAACQADTGGGTGDTE